MCTRPWFIAVLAACTPDPPPVSTAAPNGQMAVGAWLAVRPLLTQVWTAESDTESATFGDSVAPAGDVNGDGYGDVVVGGRDYSNGESREGGAFLYLGSAAGLETIAAWSVESNEPGAALGASATSAGDVNGDGYGDVVVGAYLYDNGEDDTHGRATLYLGSSAGLDQTAAWVAESDQRLAGFGVSVASAGDVNGDGYGDVVVGAYQYDNGEQDEGRAFLYLGSETGLGTTAAWTAEPNQETAFYGISVASAGDVNGDGYGDVLVGAYLYDNGERDEGRVYLYLGSNTGLGSTAAWTAESDQDDAHLGYSASSAGDVNADGYDDVVLGAGPYTNGQLGEGRAFLYLGSATGLDAIPAWIVESDETYAQLGFSVSSAGDVNADGYDDVVAGAVGSSHPELGEGRAFVYLGSATGLGTLYAWTAEPDQEFADFGNSVSSAGDVNGDGFDDLVVGAPDADHGEIDEGRAWVYLGGCPGGAVFPFVDSDADQISDTCDVCPGADDLRDGIDEDGDGACSSVDCVDTDATVYPGAPELCDGLDNACVGVVPADEQDADGDGYHACSGDCDDDEATVFLGATERCDGVDNACAGAIPDDESDADFDGVRACDGDCDDSDHRTYPGALELCDGRDNDCSQSLAPSESDADGDGFSPCAGDCDDGDSTASPESIERCGDNIDNNCDGDIDVECADNGCGCAGSGAPGSWLGVLAVLATMLGRRRLAPQVGHNPRAIDAATNGMITTIAI